MLVINAGLDKSPKHRQTWAQPGWLPREIGITIEGGNTVVSEGDQLRTFRNYRSMVVYELVGLVADVTSAERQKSHLVSFVNGLSPPSLLYRGSSADFPPVSISERNPHEVNEWHLFNDFLVGRVDEEEALGFANSWKTPVILTYQIQRARHNIDDSWKNSLGIKCLYYNGSME